jgi:hypothetical protein
MAHAQPLMVQRNETVVRRRSHHEFASRFLARLRQCLQKPIPIRIVAKDQLSLIAAGHHIVKSQSENYKGCFVPILHWKSENRGREIREKAEIRNRKIARLTPEFLLQNRSWISRSSAADRVGRWFG